MTWINKCRITSPSIHYQLSTLNYQPSTINYQPSTINHQLSTLNHQLPSSLVDADGGSFGPGAGAFGTDGADTRAEVLRHGQSLEEMAGRAAGEGRGAVPERREGETSLRETGSQREATTILAVVRAGECFAQ